MVGRAVSAAHVLPPDLLEYPVAGGHRAPCLVTDVLVQRFERMAINHVRLARDPDVRRRARQRVLPVRAGRGDVPRPAGLRGR